MIIIFKSGQNESKTNDYLVRSVGFNATSSLCYKYDISTDNMLHWSICWEKELFTSLLDF